MLTACGISKVILAYCLHLYPYRPPLIFREHEVHQLGWAIPGLLFTYYVRIEWK